MRVVLDASEFDPGQASRTFTISANNYTAHAVIPAFVRRVVMQAPSIVVEVRHSSLTTHSPSTAWRVVSGPGFHCIPCCRF
jgi:hypothetical protein